jgi:hypothetical protein
MNSKIGGFEIQTGPIPPVFYKIGSKIQSDFLTLVPHPLLW